MTLSQTCWVLNQVLLERFPHRVNQVLNEQSCDSCQESISAGLGTHAQSWDGKRRLLQALQWQ